MDLPVIELEQVSKNYRLPVVHSATVGNKFMSLLLGQRRRYASQPALREVSFSVEKGEKIALLGPNGAGKTTLLKIVAGILHPDQGRVAVRGTVAPLLHMGVGFHSDLTGRENVFLSCSLFGLSRAETTALYDQIVEFAELEDFMDVPVACYSSGMKARLGFAVSSSMDADIYLLDEGLSAGDQGFKIKCKRRIQELLAQEKTWLIATHNSQEVGTRCSRAFLMQRGTLQVRESYQQAYEEYCQICEESARARCGDLFVHSNRLVLPDGSSLKLQEERCRGEVRRVDLDDGRVRFSGWAYDTELQAPAEEFLVFLQDRCVARTPVELERPAVARSVGCGVAALGFMAELEAGRESSEYRFFARSDDAACPLELRQTQERQPSANGARRRKHPTVFAVTHWKAGSQWTAQMLRELAPRRAVEANVDTVRLAQPLKLGGIYAPVYLTREAFQRVLLRRHRQHPYRAFFILRDLRDSLISFYFSSLYSHKLIDERMAKRRERLQQLEKEAALLDLLEHDFIPFAWIQSSWMGGTEPCFRYEDLLSRPLPVMEQIVEYCELKVRPEQLADVIERNSFEQRTGRTRGEEDPLQHIRKGVAGDWENHFTPAVAKRFLELYGDVLLETGYEKDRSWIDRVK